MNTARTIGLFTLLCFAGTASAATVRDAQRQSFLSARAAYRNTIARTPALQKIQGRELLRRMGTSLGLSGLPAMTLGTIAMGLAACGNGPLYKPAVVTAALSFLGSTTAFAKWFLIDERTATVARGVRAGLIDARTADAWRGAGLILDKWRDHLAMREASDRIP